MENTENKLTPERAAAARQRMIDAAKHDAEAVLMYGNDAPAMRKTLAKHVMNLLIILGAASSTHMDDTVGLDRDDEVGQQQRNEYRKEI